MATPVQCECLAAWINEVQCICGPAAPVKKVPRELLEQISLTQIMLDKRRELLEGGGPYTLMVHTKIGGTREVTALAFDQETTVAVIKYSVRLIEEHLEALYAKMKGSLS